MSIDDPARAVMPELVGAPVTGRPARPAAETQRPLDRDDLPIAAYQTDEERRIAEALRADASTGGDVDHGGDGARLTPGPFRLRALGRLLRRS